MLISLCSPHLIPYTHSIIQFSTDHLPPLMSFPICCTMMLQFLLLPLSLQNSGFFMALKLAPSLWILPSAVFLSLACLLLTLPSGLSSGCFPPIHTFSLWFIYWTPTQLWLPLWSQQHFHLFFDAPVFFTGICPLDLSAWTLKPTGTRLCAVLLQLVYSPNE